VKTSSHTRVCVHADEVEPEEGGEKKASKRIVATWHPYGTAPDGTHALTIRWQLCDGGEEVVTVLLA
jgi:hypothetical protein